MKRQYSNELPAELLATIDQSPFKAEELVAGCLARSSAVSGEIISIPQESSIMIAREGALLPDDFLANPGV